MLAVKLSLACMIDQVTMFSTCISPWNWLESILDTPSPVFPLVDLYLMWSGAHIIILGWTSLEGKTKY